MNLWNTATNRNDKSTNLDILKDELYFLLGLNYFKYSGVFHNEGRNSRALKELKKAEKAFLKAVKGFKKGKEVESYYYLGLTYERQENTKKAITYYKKALSKEPDYKAVVKRLNICIAK